jgi:hypothetical protein
MKKTKSLYHGHRFAVVVISCAVRWYFRFQLSLRASLYRKQLARRFDAWHRFTELAQNPSAV